MGWDEAHGSPGSRRRRRVPKGTSCASIPVGNGASQTTANGAVSFPGALAGDRACTLVAQRPSRVLFLVQCFLRRSHLRLNRSLRDTIVTTRTDADGTSSAESRRACMSLLQHPTPRYIDQVRFKHVFIQYIYIMHTITNNRRTSRASPSVRTARVGRRRETGPDLETGPTGSDLI